MLHKFIALECTCCGKFFDVPVYCGDRFCPVCSFARQLRIRRRLEFLTSNIEPPAGFNIKHLTLTIKNQHDLPLMTRQIVQCFRKLRNTGSWKSHVNGGAFVIEVTGNTGSWHVHLHIIIEARYYPFAEILRLWMQLSPGRGVFIQNIPSHQITRYLTKYLTKCAVDETERSEVNDALKGTRLFQPFGSWFALNRLYVKPKMQCTECSSTAIMLYGEFVESRDSFFYKEVPP